MLTLNFLELLCVLWLKPNDHLKLNRTRLYMLGLNMCFVVSACIAQLVNDTTSYASAIALCALLLLWIVGVAVCMTTIAYVHCRQTHT
eukprot:SAG11_NODE_3064_length_2717_cov_1.713140_4_plen_88_part_00